MSSATKTFELLWHFTELRPEIGLSQMCKLAKRDKATTYRHMQALEKAGFVEQNTVSKQYRLGPALLQLARTREATVPRATGAKDPLWALAEEIGETSHVSVLSGTTVYPLLCIESPAHSTRAVIDIATFPLHATASGLCAIAFGPEDLNAVAHENMQAFTSKTATTAQDLGGIIRHIRTTGFGWSNQAFEDEIQSLSAPIFDTSGYAGAVSVACVATRFTPDAERAIKHNLRSASRAITHNWGGRIPPHIEALWDKTLAPSNTLEATS